MKFINVRAVFTILWITICYGLPVDDNQGEGYNEFVFLLPNADGDNSLYNLRKSSAYGPGKLPFSLGLLPPPLPSDTERSNPVDNNENGLKSRIGDTDDASTEDEISFTGQGIRTIETNGVKFPIPSYASGIMKISQLEPDIFPFSETQNKNDVPVPSTDLLPPAAGEEQIDGKPSRDSSLNDISRTTTDRNTPSTNANPTNNLKTPAASTSSAQGGVATPNIKASFDIPSLDILPPLPSEGHGGKDYKVSAPGFSNNPFLSPSKPTTASSSTPFKFNTVPTKPVPLNERFGTPSNNNIATPPSSAFKPSITSGVYTGGFGGAPGILGDQKNPGYAVRPDGTIKDPNQPKPTPSKPVIPPQPITPVVKPLATPVARPGTPTKSTGTKYTGGFGGPPGFLSPYDNVLPLGSKPSV